MQLSSACRDYLRDCRQRRLSPVTIKTYTFFLNELVAVVGDVEATALTRDQLREWGLYAAEKWAPISQQVAVTITRALLRWLRREGIALPDDVGDALLVPRQDSEVQRTLSVDDMLALLAVEPPERGVTRPQAELLRVRNQAIVTVLFDTLLRNAELCSLNIADVNLDRGEILVRHGKGGKVRMTIFGARTAPYLAAWLEARARLNPSSPALFVSVMGPDAGQRLTTNSLRSILGRMSRKAGIERVSPHAARRGGATAKIMDGMNDQSVMRIAGWATSDMLTRYTRALVPQDVKAANEAASDAFWKRLDAARDKHAE